MKNTEPSLSKRIIFCVFYLNCLRTFTVSAAGNFSFFVLSVVVVVVWRNEIYQNHFLVQSKGIRTDDLIRAALQQFVFVSFLFSFAHTLPCNFNRVFFLVFVFFLFHPLSISLSHADVPCLTFAPYSQCAIIKPCFSKCFGI